jgi:hypothetical protein
LKIVLVLASCSLLLFFRVSAQTCTKANSMPWSNGTGFNYKVNGAAAPQFLQAQGQVAFTSSAFRLAMIAAADAWSEASNSGYFNYTGDTSLTDIPTTKAACDSQNKNFSIVVAVDACLDPPNASAIAVIAGRCAVNGVATQFAIFVPSRRVVSNTCVNFPWSDGLLLGATSPAAFDLHGAVSHEFGHALGLNHPSEGGDSRYAVLSGSVPNRNNQRAPREYDLDCLFQKAAQRNLTGHYRVVYGNSVQTSNPSFTGSWSVVRASIGRTFHSPGSPQWRWSAAVRKKDDCTVWTRDLNTSNTSPCLDTSSQISNRVGIGYSDVVWPDYDQEMQQVFYSDYVDEPNPDDHQTGHRLKYVRSASEFQSGTQATASVTQCTAMSSWMVCSNSEPLRTNYSTSHAWIGGDLNLPLIAWANATTFNDGSDGRVRIAIGTLGYARVPIGDDITPGQADATSDVGPAVVCKHGQTPYPCLVFYVPTDVRGADVRVRRFSVTSNALRYLPSFEASSYLVADPELGVVAQTGQRIAAWYSGDHFFVAVKSMSSGQTLRIFRSVNGANWQLVAGNWETTISGPTAVGYADWADNVIVTTR